MQALLELISAFNRGSLDVPAGLFTPKTTFSLNGRSYETLLGGSPDDPLIRLLARGAAGYRTAAKALQYGLQHPVISVESQSDPDSAGGRVVRIRVEGRLRHSGAAFDGRAALHVEGTDRQVDSLNVTCAEEDLERIASSRKV